MKLDEIKMSADLSKLEFSEEELLGFASEFDEIDEVIKRVEGVSCDVEYKIPVKEYADLKEDVVEPSYSREEILKNAPRKDSISFILPKVVE
ncbi:MAG: aspartyl/glutamyl-tRNA amidotransferase subunit C [Clostridia bacterium]|nr:aspartyl/glutamyl-tRNA amidotransferase subunit C [Clostridia bacterium]